MPHPHPHAFGFLNPAAREGLTLSRRNLLKAGLAGLGGLTLPELLQARDGATGGSRPPLAKDTSHAVTSAVAT